MVVSRTVISVAAILGVVAGTALAVNIQTVPVGNPGNAGEQSRLDIGDTTYYGGVAYSYNIGKYEVTAGQYTEFLNAVAATDTYWLYNTNMSRTGAGSGISRGGSPGSYTYSVDPAFVNRPVNWASWGDAARFANWLHNGQPTGAQGLSTTEDGAYYLNGARSDAALLAVTREVDWKWAITSEDEWYKAAYYNPAAGTYHDYPTSSNTAPGRDLVDASGNNANYYGNPYPIDSPYYTTVVGEFQNSASSYGTFDQGGNVSEWNEAVIRFDWNSSRGWRGGSFSHSYGDYLRAAYRGAYLAAADNHSIGFRVVQVPEPTSMALLALGGVGMLIRRRGLGR